MQRPGTETIRTQIQPRKQKREITKIKYCQKNKENIWSTDTPPLKSNTIKKEQKVLRKKNPHNSINKIKILIIDRFCTLW